MQFAGRSSSSPLASRHTAQREAIPLEPVPPAPASFTPHSHAKRTGRKCLLVHGGSRGRAHGPAQGTAEQAKAAAGKEQFLANLPFGGGGAGAARAGHGGGCGGATSATSRTEHTAPTGATAPTATRAGWHAVCRSPAWPKCRSITGHHLSLASPLPLDCNVWESFSIF